MSNTPVTRKERFLSGQQPLPTPMTKEEGYLKDIHDDIKAVDSKVDALSSATKWRGVTTTELTDGASTNPIVINGESYTAASGDIVAYGDKEFVFNGTIWQEFGAGSGIFWINVTKEEQVDEPGNPYVPPEYAYISDKTAGEIDEAYTNGMLPVVLYDDDVYQLLRVSIYSQGNYKSYLFSRLYFEKDGVDNLINISSFKIYTNPLSSTQFLYGDNDATFIPDCDSASNGDVLTLYREYDDISGEYIDRFVWSDGDDRLLPHNYAPEINRDQLLILKYDGTDYHKSWEDASSVISEYIPQINEVPDTASASEGDILTVDTGGYHWSAPPSSGGETVRISSIYKSHALFPATGSDGIVFSNDGTGDDPVTQTSLYGFTPSMYTTYISHYEMPLLPWIQHFISEVDASYSNTTMWFDMYSSDIDINTRFYNIAENYLFSSSNAYENYIIDDDDLKRDDNHLEFIFMGPKFGDYNGPLVMRSDYFEGFAMHLSGTLLDSLTSPQYIYKIQIVLDMKPFMAGNPFLIKIGIDKEAYYSYSQNPINISDTSNLPSDVMHAYALMDDIDITQFLNVAFVDSTSSQYIDPINVSSADFESHTWTTTLTYGLLSDTINIFYDTSMVNNWVATLNDGFNNRMYLLDGLVLNNGGAPDANWSIVNPVRRVCMLDFLNFSRD